jgi:hypothetical protein
MPRPGFYNDNEYRAYPFIYTGSADTSLPTSLIVDAGVVMGLDAEFDPASHSVWLSSIARINQMLTVEFATDAPGALEVPLQFTTTIADNVWQTGFAETRTADLTAVPCAAEPIWEGFLTTGALAADLDPYFIITFAANQHQLEPARIQNLAKSYLRSISVGNFARTTIPACDTLNSTNRPIVLNTECMKGNIRFKEGYNCAITQTDRAKEISVGAGVTSGMAADSDLCAAGGEIPLYAGEAIPENNKFYGGGPACNELITTINGVNSRTLNIIGGTGVQIGTAPHKITVALNTNSQNNCATP